MTVLRTVSALALLLAWPACSGSTTNAIPAKAGCIVGSQACLELIARSYIDGLIAHDGSQIPLADNVRRTENALTNAKGPAEVRESFARTGMVEAARRRRTSMEDSSRRNSGKWLQP